MAAEIFTAISALRMVLNTETDADSPDNETTFAAIRVAIESLFMILLGTGFDGTVSGISTTTITHAEAAQVVDVHNGRTTLMTSGACKGNFYTIDDCAAQTLIHTGDDLEADGVAIGDTFVVLFDIKTNLVGHDHDAINSKNVVLADGSVATVKYADNSVTMEKIEHGTMHSLPWDHEDGTEYSRALDGYATVITGTIYIPTNATTLYGYFRTYRDTDGNDCNIRFSVDGNASAISNINTTSYTWQAQIGLDCSAITAGYQTLIIELESQDSRTAYLKGYTFRWA